MTFPTFVAAVMGAHLPTADFRGWLRDELSARELHLAPDDLFYHQDQIVGRYRLLDPAEAAATFGGEEWFSLEDRGPWLGRPVGFFCWTHAADEGLARAHLLPALVRCARGPVARTDSREVRSPVREREFALGELLGKHGFDDGDALLSRTEEAYLRYAVHQAEDALARAGFTGHVGIFGSHHNPLRLSGDLTRGGAPLPEPEQALAHASMHLWTFDWGVLDEIAFWID